MALDLAQLLPLLAELNRDRPSAIPLSTIAKALGLSPWYVQRTFAEIVGESPKQYRLRLRLECAAALLLSSEDSVLEIALAVGFESHEGFTRAFRKRFGIAPTAYRVRRDESVSFSRHAHAIAGVGPCVHLFRKSTNPDSKETTAMSYDITRQKIDETHVLYISRRVEHSGLAEAIGEILPACFGFAVENGLEMTGPPFTRYVEWSPAFVTIEAGVPLAKAAEVPADRTDLVAGVLPGGEAAVTIHTGPYDTLGVAHAAVERWLAENEIDGTGKLWEIYLTDPGEVPNPAEWKTQIVWPIGG